MNRKLIAAIMAIAAVTLSCGHKVEPDDSGSNSGSNSGSDSGISATASIEDFVIDGDTKTTFTIGDNVTFEFNDDDVLRIWPETNTYGARFTVMKNSGISCSFTGKGFDLAEGTSYSAFYPGTNRDYAINKVGINYTGQAQPAKNGYDLGSADFLYSTGIKPQDGRCHFTMKHVGALLVMDVTFSEAGTYTSLSLTSKGNPFVTAGTIDLKSNPPSISLTESSQTVTLALGGPGGIRVDAGETVRFCMMTAPVDLSGATILLEVASGADAVSAEISGKNYKAGKAYKISGSASRP